MKKYLIELSREERQDLRDLVSLRQSRRYEEGPWKGPIVSVTYSSLCC